MHTLSARRITEMESASESVWSCSCRKDCDVCKKEYKSKEDLISHMMTVQNNGEINCSKSSSFLFTRSLFLQKAFACLKIQFCSYPQNIRLYMGLVLAGTLAILVLAILQPYWYQVGHPTLDEGRSKWDIPLQADFDLNEEYKAGHPTSSIF